MKKLMIWSMMMLMVMTLPLMVSCGGDDSGESGPSGGSGVNDAWYASRIVTHFQTDDPVIKANIEKYFNERGRYQEIGEQYWQLAGRSSYENGVIHATPIGPATYIDEIYAAHIVSDNTIAFYEGGLFKYGASGTTGLQLLYRIQDDLLGDVAYYGYSPRYYTYSREGNAFVFFEGEEKITFTISGNELIIGGTKLTKFNPNTIFHENTGGGYTGENQQESVVGEWVQFKDNGSIETLNIMSNGTVLVTEYRHESGDNRYKEGWYYETESYTYTLNGNKGTMVSESGKSHSFTYYIWTSGNTKTLTITTSKSENYMLMTSDYRKQINDLNAQQDNGPNMNSGDFDIAKIVGSYEAYEYEWSSDDEKWVYIHKYNITFSKDVSSSTSVAITNLWAGNITIYGNIDQSSGNITINPGQIIYYHNTYGDVWLNPYGDDNAVKLTYYKDDNAYQSSIYVPTCSEGIFGYFYVNMYKEDSSASATSKRAQPNSLPTRKGLF